jgi:hypothetical protein
MISFCSQINQLVTIFPNNKEVNMKSIVNLFLLSFFCSFNIFAIRSPIEQKTTPPAILQIASASEQGGKTTITLTNGMCWEYRDGGLFSIPSNEQMLNKVPRVWKVGDRVRIVYVWNWGYHLENISYPGSIPVDLLNASSSTITATKIRTILKNGSEPHPSHARMLDEGGTWHTLTLDDGTMWYVGWWSSAWMKNWNVGDRVILSPNDFITGRATHLMINLDRPSSENSLRSNVRAQLLRNSNAKPAPKDSNQRPGRSWTIQISKIYPAGENYAVELSNKMVWLCPKKRNCWHDWIGWSVGDTVTLEREDETFKIHNCKRRNTVSAKLANPATQIDTVTLYSYADNGWRVVLSDGSVWYFAEKKESWTAGDRIVVSRLSGTRITMSNHLLINLSRTNKHHPDLADSTEAALIR